MSAAKADAPSRFEQEFEVLGLLGHGSFGKVWHCRHRGEGREYAVKQVRQRIQSAAADDFEENLLREARICASANHRYIVDCHDAWIEVAAITHGPPQPAIAEPQFASGDLAGVSTCGYSSFGAYTRTHSEGDVVFDELEGDSTSNAMSTSVGAVLQSSPQDCPDVLDQESHDLTLYVQMELCSSDTLQTWIDRRNRAVASGDLSRIERRRWAREASTLFSQCVAALAHLEECGVAHRDVKPANVLLAKDGSARLADFGLARLVNGKPATPTCSERGAGTPCYASPEQLSGICGCSADVYSLGVVLVELFCPVQTKMERAVLLEGLSSSRQLPADVADALPTVAQLVVQMTAPEPMLRPSAREILELDLKGLFSEVANGPSDADLGAAEASEVASELQLPASERNNSLPYTGKDSNSGCAVSWLSVPTQSEALAHAKIGIQADMCKVTLPGTKAHSSGAPAQSWTKTAQSKAQDSPDRHSITIERLPVYRRPLCITPIEHRGASVTSMRFSMLCAGG